MSWVLAFSALAPSQKSVGLAILFVVLALMFVGVGVTWLKQRKPPPPE
jgi:hypothetical protein